MRLLLAGLFVYIALMLGVVALGEAGALDRRQPGWVALPVGLGVLGAIVCAAFLIFGPRGSAARRRKLLAAARRVVEEGGELAPRALEHNLSFVRTHRDLLDAQEALRREASGMRPSVRALVILMGLVWLTCAAWALADGERGVRGLAAVWMALGAVVMWFFVLVPLRRRRALLRGSARRTAIALRTSARCVQFDIAGIGAVRRWWRDLDLLLPTAKGIVLGFADGTVQWVPARAFAGRSERERFVRDVEERMAQEDARRTLPPTEHPLLDEPWTYWIGELRYWKDVQGTCLDVTLRRGVETRRLRFLRPVEVVILGDDLFQLESGIVILSQPQAELDGLRVAVTGRDGEPGLLNLWAEDVVDLDALEGARVGPTAELPDPSETR